MGFKIAILGATGNVGRQMLSVLDERNFPVDEIYAIASKRSAGKPISFGDRETLKTIDIDQFDFSKVDLVLASAGSEVSKKYIPAIAAKGVMVIDNASYFRMDPDVPLVVPEVNADAIKDAKKNIIANPNCSTIQIVTVLKPLHDVSKIKRVVVSTYQSVSGAGKAAMDELFNQTRMSYMNQEAVPEQFAKKIAFNVIPHIDSFMDDGGTKEEWKMVVETKKILDPKIKVTATAVRVPVFIGHSEAVNIEFEDEMGAEQARKILRKAKGVVVVDDTEMENYVTPIEAAGEDSVYVSRIRDDYTIENGINLWIVADNLRKGAALNAVQIAELWAKNKKG